MGFSQEEFADQMGVTRVTQNYYENGKREPGLGYLSTFGRNGGDLLYLLFADRAPNIEYAEILDWSLFDKIWGWVHRGAGDAECRLYSIDAQTQIFRLAYRICRKTNLSDPGSLDFTTLALAAAAASAEGAVTR